jgi:hypothetical protein
VPKALPARAVRVTDGELRAARGRPFEEGNPGGPGRPNGSRNKATLAVQELLDGQAEAITQKAVDLAFARRCW